MTAEHTPAPGAQETADGLAALFDPWSPAYIADPHPFFARARAEEPIFYSPQVGMWVVTRYEDISTVFRDPARFSAANVLTPLVSIVPEALQVLKEGGYSFTTSITALDPPQHTRVRAPLTKVFSARRVALMEPRIRTYANGLLDGFIADGRADLIRQFAFPLPALVVFNLIGIPEADMEQIKGWFTDFILLASGNPTPEQQVACAHSMVALRAYLTEFVLARQRAPQDDLASDLAALIGDDGLQVPDVVSLLGTLSTAGHETTTSAIGNALLYLLGHPAYWEQLRADPALCAQAAEEILRFEPSVTVWRRMTTQEVELGGTVLPKGAKLALVLASGNRDACVFADPDRFDLGRENSHNHLSFGRGIHYCAGAPLARLEIQIALEVCATRLLGLQLLADQPVTYLPAFSVRGPRALLATWGT